MVHSASQGSCGERAKVCCCRRQHRCLFGRQPAPATLLQSRDQSLQLQAQTTAIDAFIFKLPPQARAGPGGEGGRDGLRLCLLPVRDGEEVRELRCHHFFHHACIDAWLVRPRATCPLCCDRLLPADVPLTSESGYNRLSSSASAYTHGGAIWWHMT
ncbi:E3 ubiquitin-protein ligase RNF165-like [Sorghum bicolor]|uniref:E3 ubiquitin-protein ligase RNF165-like n=1 Tax=Sorghum bicolor TaxID=4558 RepID=UPI000B42542E|nr:E3 ubiquitin-protein ligase RNF165-like [Sorghum bicolor]|eukprot:XP_021304591.1 E3 ubiquitin-protein ligase RNF165-like [Sorghum bicolor]